MSEFSKAFQEFDKDASLTQTSLSLGNGFSVTLIKGERKFPVESIQIPVKKGPKRVA